MPLCVLDKHVPSSRQMHWDEMRVPHPPTVTQWVWGVHVFSFTYVQARVTTCAHVECCPRSHLILSLETEPFTEPGLVLSTRLATWQAPGICRSAHPSSGATGSPPLLPESKSGCHDCPMSSLPTQPLVRKFRTLNGRCQIIPHVQVLLNVRYHRGAAVVWTCRRRGLSLLLSPWH